MSDNVGMKVSASPAAYGATGAAVGALFGAFTAPRKYNLEQLITVESDSFQKVFPRKVMDLASKQQHSAIDNIKTARKAFITAGTKKSGDVKLLQLLENKSLNADYKTVKSLIPKARAMSAVIGAIVLGVIAALGRMIFKTQDG